MEHTKIALTQVVEKEMAKFERQEAEFRQKDREERAAQLNSSADGYKLAH